MATMPKRKNAAPNAFTHEHSKSSKHRKIASNDIPSDDNVIPNAMFDNFFIV